MAKKDPNGSVHDEQFGKAENTKKKQEKKKSSSAPKKKPAAGSKGTVTRKKKSEEKNITEESIQSPSNPQADIAEITIPENESIKSEADISLEADVPEAVGSGNEVGPMETESIKETQNDTMESVSEEDSHLAAGSTEKPDISDDESSEDTEHEEGEQIVTDVKEDSGKATPPKYIPEEIDYTKLSREDLVKVLSDIIGTGMVGDIRHDVEAIKSSFYKKNKAEIDEIRKNFLADGGQIQDFKVEESPVEAELKELLNKYRDLRNDVSKKLDDEKITNLTEKYRIIEAIKELVNSQESLNRTFQEFRDLQNQWREIGPVPQQNLKDLWESYHYHVEAFYDYIKINKELRDLDLKKNLESKMKLCETAEELLLEPSVVEAFKHLQKLHDQWREIGPVPLEKRTEIWERFKEATTKINRKHQEYFVSLKHDQKKNLEEKIMLCNKAEEISILDLSNHKEWEEKSNELIELQKVWKTIGFAPKKYNTQVYERFRKACDTFFEKKREYYSQNREEQQNNLQLKTELCIQAEALKDNTDWKKTTDEFIALQKKWKEIGPVPLKQSDKIWKRFRAACDTFFANKVKFFSQADSRYEENLEKKRKLIELIGTFEPTSDVEKNLNALKDFQRQWSEIGFVPIKYKNEIQDQYRLVLNNKFDQLKLDDNKKALLKFRNRVEGITGRPNSQHRLHVERDKCFNKLKQLENDITLWENNIGFFANSANAESMINDVNNKIEAAKLKIEQLKGKIRMLDEFED
jgi:hypothetical protein